MKLSTKDLIILHNDNELFLKLKTHGSNENELMKLFIKNDLESKVLEFDLTSFYITLEMS